MLVAHQTLSESHLLGIRVFDRAGATSNQNLKLKCIDCLQKDIYTHISLLKLLLDQKPGCRTQMFLDDGLGQLVAVDREMSVKHNRVG